MQAIILAGGKGTRLRPFTTNFPKPLVPIDDLPILEIVLRQLKHYGFTDVVLAVNHLAELIMAFFRNGEKLGMKISYSMEDQVLGTAGPLALIDHFEDDFIVMNGDTLTTINYKQLFDFHVNNDNDLTIAMFKKQVKIDLGVLEVDGDKFVNYVEKPTFCYNVSTGIYVFNKTIVNLIEKNKKLDMPELVLRAQHAGKKIKCFTGDYSWLDIGRPDDYDEAIRVFKEQRGAFLP